VLAVALTTWWHLTHWAFGDFIMVHCSLVSFLAGKNPYDASTYVLPVESRFAYPPLALLIHLPFGFLSLEVAQTVHYVANLALIPVLSALTLRLAGIEVTLARTLGHATLVLLSRPGHANVVMGQTAALLVISIYIALLFARRRPWLAGLALAVTTFKPTFAIPLALLMLVRRDVVPAVVGMALGGIASVASLLVIAGRVGGVMPLLNVLAENYHVFRNRLDNLAFTGPYRLDAVALVGRLVGRPLGTPVELGITLGVLALGAWCVHRLARSEDPAARRLSASVICVTVLTCAYHQGYDGLILALPITALATTRWAPADPAAATARWVLLGLLAIPVANHLATYTPLSYFQPGGAWWTALTSLNGAALLSALLVYTAVTSAMTAASPVRIGPGSFRIAQASDASGTAGRGSDPSPGSPSGPALD
jgi:hypothetical protein